jgi:hypothetical protein
VTRPTEPPPPPEGAVLEVAEPSSTEADGRARAHGQWKGGRGKTATQSGSDPVERALAQVERGAALWFVLFPEHEPVPPATVDVRAFVERVKALRAGLDEFARRGYDARIRAEAAYRVIDEQLRSLSRQIEGSGDAPVQSSNFERIAAIAHAAVRSAGASLLLSDAHGNHHRWTSPSVLARSTEVAAVWDSLKLAHARGELVSWISAVIPGWRPPALSSDAELSVNAILWSAGHKGMILEWGVQDFAVVSPDDLWRAYHERWDLLDAHVRRGTVLAWITRFFGAGLVAGRSRSALCDFIRERDAQLPAGHAALAAVLLFDAAVLPLDPCVPGDVATVRGYHGVSGVQCDGAPWRPLRAQLRSGTALLWAAQLPKISLDAMKRCMQLFFERDRPRPDALCEEFGWLFGPPVATPALAAQLYGASLDVDGRASFVSIAPALPLPPIESLPLPPPPEPAPPPPAPVASAPVASAPVEPSPVASAPPVAQDAPMKSTALGPSGRFYAECPKCQTPNYGDIAFCMGCHGDLTAAR